MASDHVLYLYLLDDLKHKVTKQYQCCVNLFLGEAGLGELL